MSTEPIDEESKPPCGKVTFEEFKLMVKDHTPVERDRENIARVKGNRPAYYDLLVRSGYAQLQRFIELYRKEHEKLYKAANVSNEGSASKFTLPCEADLKEIKLVFREPDGEGGIVSSEASADEVDWLQRNELICKRGQTRDKPLVAIQPQMDFAYIWPQLAAPSPDNDVAIEMIVIYDGVRRDFSDTDIIRAGAEEAECVSYYVLDKVLRQVDEVGIADRMKADFKLKRKELYLDARRRKHLKRKPLGTKV